MEKTIELDKKRYIGNGDSMPRFQYYYRKMQTKSFFPLKLIYKFLFKHFKAKNHIELFYKTQIGPGLYIGHPYEIMINRDAVIGKNVNIHKGVTIGQENRGKRKGVPVIGDNVWIGVNSTVVGKITIGNDVLIAPNSFVNCDVPDHSIVIGNPCIIKHKENATKDYINHTI